MMIDENLARLRAPRDNMARYRRLLKTNLRSLSATSSNGALSEEGTA